MKLEYFYYDELSTEITVDFKTNKISIINHTTDNMKRAFGVNEQPTMDDFKYLLEDRCFPSTRDHMKEILRDLGLTCYEPLEIIMITEGRMAGDPMSLRIVEE